ncbi:hypothetical protein B0H14DRAFT_2248317, partial [Mycena olivaceomarginata]
RVQAILSKIQSGTDLTGDQKADVFALSMSKVFFVDWQWKHHLNIDPEIKLPTRMTHMSQHPLTEKQKTWFYDILDVMEGVHVIQHV